ncbi:transposase [Rhodocaloribacter litoris]|uniref:RNA-guided endonuclease InsQ/TnpB family protein n=1 Tax=Rhodocaloribacter litoris TaxID=2558931 RepID=UPI001E5DDB73|nr:transposase [Rhodocaloribacter litoris]QXD16553.1 transposase [Rhodocaloribacter litoris]
MCRKTLKYRLYTSKKDKHLIEQIEVAASIWNHSVALTRRYYRMYGKPLGANRLMKHIAKLRRRNPYWQKLGSQAVQDVIQRLDRAYQRFFAARTGRVHVRRRSDRAASTRGRKAGRPGFKSRHRYSSFTLKQAGWKYLGGNRLRVGRHNFKFVLSRPLEGEIKTLTIKRDRCGDLWVCFSVVVADVTPSAVGCDGHAVGLDFGLKTFLTTSDGDRYEAPQPLKQSLKEMAKRQRSLSRKLRGSNNRRKARIRVARLHRRIADQRRDWHFKLAHKICDGADVICLEDLCLKGMQAMWGRKVGDLGYGQFVSILRHVAQKRGKTVLQVDRFFASSKTCSDCGALNQTLSLSDREWVCASCGSLHDRDVNAAVNICREGASSLGVGDVRPSTTPLGGVGRLPLKAIS